MALVTPSNTPMSLYATSTLSVQACPTLDASWSATPTPLPPTPNSALCNCMVAGLACRVNNSTSSDIYGDLFNYICANDTNACVGITSNGTTGVYGAYSGCTPEQQLSFVMNRFYLDSSSQSYACDFSGNASVASAASPSGTCSSLLSAAGTYGTGTVASVTGKSSGTGTAAASTKATTTGAASGLSVPNFDFGLLQMSVYVIGAVLVGAGMILL